jgi:histidinol dehydrogenase
MRVQRWSQMDAAARAAWLVRGTERVFDPDLAASVREIVDDVRQNGDAAVCRALARFDGCEVDPDRLLLTDDEIDSGADAVAPAVLAAIREAIANVRAYNERVMEADADWRIELAPGLVVGEQSRPIAAAGVFVPSGKGSFPSVLVQIGTPAVVAGVPRVTVIVPPVPGSEGRVDAAVLAVAKELGLRRILRANGPAGVAAAAFGTESVDRVDKVLGPGSPPVQAAMLEVQRFGCVTQMVLGPSESLILADDSADPRLLAADLLNEAEHGGDSASILVTDSEALVAATEANLAEQIAALPPPRGDYARASLGPNGGAILVRDMHEGAEVANLWAPEHMQIVARDDEAILARIDHAGEVLMGQSTPIAAANYTIGVPAALPTGRFARVSSAVTARTFRKATSIARSSDRALEQMAPAICALADHEGFPAHAAAIRIRHHIPPTEGVL